MERLSSKMKQRLRNKIEWRRNKVLELSSHGKNQSEISRIFQISVPTVNRDATYLREEAKLNIRRYIDERLPEEYEKCLVGITSILREAWDTSQDAEDKREKIQALSLAKECYAMKLDLLTNAAVVDDAIRFVSSHVVAAATEKDNTDDRVSEDEEISDVQRSQEGHSRQQSTTTATTTTNNTIF
jgi:hypothetical protein